MLATLEATTKRPMGERLAGGELLPGDQLRVLREQLGLGLGRPGGMGPVCCRCRRRCAPVNRRCRLPAQRLPAFSPAACVACMPSHAHGVPTLYAALKLHVWLS